MPKKKPVEEKVVEIAEDEGEEVTCPVCGKPVGLDVATCPFCGAEFEEEEVEEVVEAAEEEEVAEEAEEEQVEEAVEEEEETAECPVCGKMVSLLVSSCPNCGAEFEEEEIEEVIEVVEPEEVQVERPQSVEEIEEEIDEILVEERPAAVVSAVGPPTRITDLRVIGASLVMLGILGSQISFMIDWYWTWVPPIGDNLVLFVLIPVVVILAGLGVFVLMKRRGTPKKKSSKVPWVALSLFLFGILALIMVMLWNPINTALQDSNLGVGGAFVAMLIFGALAVFMGSKTATPKGSY